VLSEFSNGVKGRGTGTLIGSNCFVTAAHCIYDPDYGGHAKNVTFFVGIKGVTDNWDATESSSLSYLKKSRAQGVYVHKSYITGGYENQLHYDMAIVHMKEDFGKDFGWASLKAFKDDELIKKAFNVTGYPSPGAEPIAFNTCIMKTMEGPISAADNHRIHYDIDTSGGQSGAALWKLESNVIKCAGIHANGFTETDSHNNATRINGANFAILKLWLDEISRKSVSHTSSNRSAA
jgi:glutamyl endopeptidase